jgi:hypothetical protein
MADPLPDRDTDAATPRWVKLSALAAAIVAALVLIMLLSGHGPGHHLDGNMPMAGGASSTRAPSAAAT